MTTTLKQFQGSVVAPEDDGKVYKFLGGVAGVVAGCVVTLYATNQLKVSDGWGFACGRVFVIEEEIVVANTAAAKGRIIVNIDLENIAKPACLATQSAAVLPALVQEDINADGTVFQLALAQYDIASNTISNLTDVRVMLYDIDSRINAISNTGGVHVINTFAEFKALWEDESASFKYAVVVNQLTIDATETIAAYGELRILSDLNFSLSANNLSLTLAGVDTAPVLKVYEAFTVFSPAAYVFSIDCGNTMGMIYAGIFQTIKTNVTVAEFTYQVKKELSGGTISGGFERNWKAGFANVTTVSAGFMSAADKTALNGKQDEISNVANRLFYGSGTAGSLNQLANPATAGSVLRQGTSGAPYWTTPADLVTALKSSLINMLYPVGAIYLSVNSTSPASLFGGTWTQLKDRFLLGAGDTYTNGNTGGEAAHALTEDETPWWRTVNEASGYSLGNAGGFANRVAINRGSSPAHNNMPPYLVVYIWKRTA